MQPDFLLPDLVRDCTEEGIDKVDRVIGEIKDSERRFGNVLQQIIQVDKKLTTFFSFDHKKMRKNKPQRTARYRNFYDIWKNRELEKVFFFHFSIFSFA